MRRQKIPQSFGKRKGMERGCKCGTSARTAVPVRFKLGSGYLVKASELCCLSTDHKSSKHRASGRGALRLIISGPCLQNHLVAWRSFSFLSFFLRLQLEVGGLAPPDIFLPSSLS